jgi:hypothetical protein
MRKELIEMGFREAGKYEMVNGTPQVVASRTKKEKLSVVYAFLANNIICYIGVSKNGYHRPFFYLRAKKMVIPRDGIVNGLKNGTSITVYVKEFKEKLSYDGLKLDLAKSYETALIELHMPLWNSDKPKKSS